MNKLMVESADGDLFGTVRSQENWADGTVRYNCHVSGPKAPRGREITLKPEDFRHEWRLLEVDDIPAAQPVSCRRCQRVFFYPGACPSATCGDLREKPQIAGI